MRIRLSADDLRGALNRDSEFRLQARYWNGSLRFEFGDEVFHLSLTDGEVTSIETAGTSRAGVGDVVVRAPVNDWAQLLAPIPKPFYQDFYPALTHHGFKLEGDPDYIWPYYAALRRSGEILRTLVTLEGA